MKTLKVLALVLLLLCFVTSVACARIWYVKFDGGGDASTIREGLRLAFVGDTVLVACGIYLEHDLEMKSKVHLMAERPRCVTVDAQQQGKLISCLNTKPSTEIEGIRFTNGLPSGMSISGWVAIRNCIFENNAGPTIDISLSSAEFYNCLFYDNGFSGVRPSWTILAVNSGTNLVIKSCTFVNNYAGIATDKDAFASIENSIVAFCETVSIMNREASGSNRVSCSDFYGNGSAQEDSAIVAQFPTNFIADPQICGISGDGAIGMKGGSPCARGNHPKGMDCGAIGATPVLCRESKPEFRIRWPERTIYWKDG